MTFQHQQDQDQDQGEQQQKQQQPSVELDNLIEQFKRYYIESKRIVNQDRRDCKIRRIS